MKFEFWIYLDIRVGIIITGIYVYWLNNVTKANDFNKEMAHDYEREINELLNFHFSKDAQNAKERIKKRIFGTYWSMIAQVCITVVLYLSAVKILSI